MISALPAHRRAALCATPPRCVELAAVAHSCPVTVRLVTRESKAAVRQLTGCAPVLRLRQDSLTGSHSPRCFAPSARRPGGLRQPRATQRSRLPRLPSTTNEKGQSVERGLQVLDGAHACRALFWQSAPSLGRNQVATLRLPGRRHVQFQGRAFLVPNPSFQVSRPSES
jgi:hypothetical protein